MSKANKFTAHWRATKIDLHHGRRATATDSKCRNASLLNIAERFDRHASTTTVNWLDVGAAANLVRTVLISGRSISHSTVSHGVALRYTSTSTSRVPKL